ncbi:MAG: hypothetical protein AB9844_00180 [Clostridiaceae bacterium]
MGYKQVIELESQETNINIDYYDKKVRMYTTKATVMNRLDRAGYRPSNVETIGGNPCSLEYEFDFHEFPKFISKGIFKCCIKTTEQED